MRRNKLQHTASIDQVVWLARINVPIFAFEMGVVIPETGFVECNED